MSKTLIDADSDGEERRPRGRYTRIAAALGLIGAAAAGIVFALIPNRAAQSPSAAAIDAADQTCAQSFRMTTTTRALGAGTARARTGVMTTVVDLGQGIAEASGPGLHELYVGGHVYLSGTPELPMAAPGMWVGFRASVSPSQFEQQFLDGQHPGADRPAQLGVGICDDQTWLRSVHQLRVAGAASGPGWTGTRYTFTTSGGGSTTVIIDRQGRLRQVNVVVPAEHAVLDGQPLSLAPLQEQTSYTDYGAPVSLATPPADKVYWQSGSALGSG